MRAPAFQRGTTPEMVGWFQVVYHEVDVDDATKALQWLAVWGEDVIRGSDRVADVMMVGKQKARIVRYLADALGITADEPGRFNLGQDADLNRSAEVTILAGADRLRPALDEVAGMDTYRVFVARQRIYGETSSPDPVVSKMDTIPPSGVWWARGKDVVPGFDLEAVVSLSHRRHPTRTTTSPMWGDEGETMRQPDRAPQVVVVPWKQTRQTMGPRAERAGRLMSGPNPWEQPLPSGPFTMPGLAAYLGVGRATAYRYRDRWLAEGRIEQIERGLYRETMADIENDS